MPASNLQMIREEPQFGSMIWCDMDARLSRPVSRRTSVATLNPYYARRFSGDGHLRRNLKDGIASELGDDDPALDEPVDIVQVYADMDPVSFTYSNKTFQFLVLYSSYSPLTLVSLCNWLCVSWCTVLPVYRWRFTQKGIQRDRLIYISNLCNYW
jgi:hypothetical protein